MWGFMYKGLCHEHQQDAIDNYYQSMPQSFFNSSTATTIVFYDKISNGSWSLVKKTVDITGSTTINFRVAADTPIFTSCQDSVGSNDLTSLTASQGALIGGAIILVWAVAFTARAIISTLNFNEDRNENE